MSLRGPAPRAHAAQQAARGTSPSPWRAVGLRDREPAPGDTVGAGGGACPRALPGAPRLRTAGTARAASGFPREVLTCEIRHGGGAVAVTGLPGDRGTVARPPRRGWGLCAIICDFVRPHGTCCSCSSPLHLEGVEGTSAPGRAMKHAARSQRRSQGSFRNGSGLRASLNLALWPPRQPLRTN